MAKFDFDRLLGPDSAPLSSVRLENVDQKTNTSKFYEIHVEQDFANSETSFRVVVYYGRIGSQNPRTEVNISLIMINSVLLTRRN